MAPSPISRLRILALAAVAALVLGACGLVSSTPPPATPTDFPGLAGRFNAAGIVVSDWVSGDPGCADQDLVPTSIAFDARGLDQAADVHVYLYVFRNRASFERLRGLVGPCAAAFVTDADTYEEVQQSPYVLAGQGPWAPGFEAAIRRTLEEAAGTGG